MNDKDGVVWAVVGVLFIGALTLIWNGALLGPRPAVAQVVEGEMSATEAPAQGLAVESLEVLKGGGLGYLAVGRTQLLAAGTRNGVHVYEVRGYGGRFRVRDVTEGAEKAASGRRPAAP